MIQKATIIGAGRMGRQIAMNTAIYDYQVSLTDNSDQALEDARQWAESYLEGRVAKGRMTAEQTAQIKARLNFEQELECALKDADLVIEAVVEVEEIKRSLLGKISQIVRDDTIIATNSSFMASSLFADAVTRPERLANLHFFNPALVLKLTEVVKGPHTSQQTVDALMEFSRSTGKKPVLVQKEIDGFIANRLLNACKNEALYLVENGYCTVEDIDNACKYGLGHPMGQFELMDTTGIDTTYYRMVRDIERTGVEPAGYRLIKEMFDSNRLGKKTGHGFYDYKE